MPYILLVGLYTVLSQHYQVGATRISSLLCMRVGCVILLWPSCRDWCILPVGLEGAIEGRRNGFERGCSLTQAGTLKRKTQNYEVWWFPDGMGGSVIMVSGNEVVVRILRLSYHH